MLCVWKLSRHEALDVLRRAAVILAACVVCKILETDRNAHKVCLKVVDVVF